MAGVLAVAGTELDAVRAERNRILSTMLAQVDGLADRAVDAIRAEIPAYAAKHPVTDAAFLADVRAQVLNHYHAKLIAFLEERSVTLEDIAFAKPAATRRARAGFALEDYIDAYRVGRQVFWEALVATARDTAVGHDAALSLVTPLLRSNDFASAHAARAYVEYQQYAVAGADRERRDLLEHLLAGEMPPPGPLLGAAQGFGLRPDGRVMVAVGLPADSRLDVDAPYVASAAIARACTGEPKTLVVARQSEIVAVSALRAGTEPLTICARLTEVQERLRREGLPLAIGVSTVATGVANLPHAYAEAHAALRCLPDGEGGIAALPRMSPFDYLTLRADETAWQLVDPRLRTFIDDDRRKDGSLVATVRAFADADLNLRLTAERLRVHPNTALYRLRRVEERTGRNPRHVTDLVDLMLAIALAERAMTLR